MLALIANREPATALAEQDSTFEQRQMADAMTSGGFIRDLSPGGKRIAFIRFVRAEVFVGEELVVPIVLPKRAPTWPNALHWLTDESVIRRELLCQEGDLYDAERIEESERNLRSLSILSLARIEAVRGAHEGEVGLLVYTRDLWSLRLETGFSGVGENYALSAQLIERNLFGRDKALALRTGLDPFAWSVGEVYADSRVMGERLTLSESLDLFMNRQTGKAEGAQAAVSFGQPFFALGQTLSWTLSASYSVSVARTLAETGLLAVRPVGGLLEECIPGEPRCYQRTWDQRSGSASAGAAYRVGQRYKQTFSLDLVFSDAAASPNADTLTDSGSEAEARSSVLPRVRRQVFPRLGYSLFLPTYAVLENLSTFGQSENLRVGPTLSASFSAPLQAFGSSTDSLVFTSGAGYVWSRHDALLEARALASTRIEDGRPGDQTLAMRLRGATPQTFGRFVGLVSFDGERRDTDRAIATLGGDNGLRGLPANALFARGGSKVFANTEYRSPPLELSTVHVGGVLFYDAGGVYSRALPLRLEHAVGAGVRVLFPQFNRSPFRLDVGVPLRRGGFSLGLSYGSDQAVPLTAVDDASSYAAVRAN